MREVAAEHLRADWETGLVMTGQPSACYVCGAPDARTKDHIFPKSLWSPPYPEGALTAPACHDCQKRLAPDETYFRTAVAASGAGSDLGARKLWEGKVIRSVDRDPRPRERLAAALKRIDWHTRGGLYLGTLVGLDGDPERIGNVLQKSSAASPSWRGTGFPDSQRGPLGGNRRQVAAPPLLTFELRAFLGTARRAALSDPIARAPGRPSRREPACAPDN